MKVMQWLLRAYLYRFPIDFGKWRLWKIVEDKSFWTDFTPAIATTRFGFRMHLTPEQHILKQIYFWGYWEPNETQVILKLLRKGDTFIDIGANAGYFSLLAAKLVGPEGKVHAFEAIPPTVDMLQANLRLNPVGNVQVHALAATDRAMTIRFANRGNSGAELNSMRFPSDNGAFWEVTGVRVDHRIDAAAPIRLIKMDIEGAELLALKGMEDMLDAAQPPILLCEVIDNFLKELGGSAREVFDFLGGKGYRHIYRCTPAGLRPLVLPSGELNQFHDNVVLSTTALVP